MPLLRGSNLPLHEPSVRERVNADRRLIRALAQINFQSIVSVLAIQPVIVSAQQLRCLEKDHRWCTRRGDTRERINQLRIGCVAPLRTVGGVVLAGLLHACHGPFESSSGFSLSHNLSIALWCVKYASGSCFAISSGVKPS